MAEHARLGLSNHRWPHCPGSIREEANYPDDTNPAAIDGTGSHLLLETCLNENKDPQSFIDQVIGVGHPDHLQGWTVKQDRIDRVKVAIDYINRRIYEENFTGLYTERRVSPGTQFQRNDWWGTSDVILFNETKLEVIDYKDGQMWVEEKNNSQLIGNGFGAAHLCMNNDGCTINHVRMTIIQPKTSRPVRYDELTYSDLKKEAQHLAECAAKTDDPDASLIPGDWCTWCKHGRAGNCEAKVAIAAEGIKAMGTGVPILDDIIQNQLTPETMTVEQLKQIKDAEPLITKLLESVEEEMMKRIESGTQIDGYGIGNGRSTNKWSQDDETIEKKLKGFRLKKADIFPVKLISPAQVLKLESLTDKQKEKIKTNMIETVPGKKKVVRIKREKPTVEQMFSGVDTRENLDVLKEELSPKPVTLSFM